MRFATKRTQKVLVCALKKPFEKIRAPGMYLVYKYQQHKRQQHEQHQQHQRQQLQQPLLQNNSQQDTQGDRTSRQVTDKELSQLNSKIDKLLAKLEERGSLDSLVTQEDECVVCMCSKATMQTFPCGHKVVCRMCFVKTIQVAVTERALPLKCVVCRTKILKLKQTNEDVLPQSPKKRQGGHSTGHGFFSSSASAKLSKPAMKARQFFLGGGNGSHKGASSSGNKVPLSHPVVTTKLMQPYLIYPSQNSPKQQRAFTLDPVSHSKGKSSGKTRAASSSKVPSTGKGHMSHVPQQSSTDSPLISARTKSKCSHQEELEPRFTHLLSPRVTSRCNHCPGPKGSRMIKAKQ